MAWENGPQPEPLRLRARPVSWLDCRRTSQRRKTFRSPPRQGEPCEGRLYFDGVSTMLGVDFTRMDGVRLRKKTIITRHLRPAPCRRIYHGTGRGRLHSGSAMNGHGPDRQEFRNPDWPIMQKLYGRPHRGSAVMVMGQTARSRSPDWPAIGAAFRYAFITGCGPPGFHPALYATSFYY